MRAEVITALFVVAMFVTSALMVYGGDQEPPSLSGTASGGILTIDYSMPSSTHAYPCSIVAVPFESYRSDNVTILLTGKGGAPSSDPANVQGLVDHLGAELRNIGSSSKVTTIDEGSLISYLAAGNGTLVIACEVNATASLMLEDWVRDGGLLVAVGPDCIPFMGPGGSLEIGLANYSYDGGTVEGSFAHDTGLRTVYPVHGLSVADVLSYPGTVLGHTAADGKLTTTATVPMGKGRLLIMGGPIEHPFLASMEDVYAWDLARLLEAGAPWVAGPIYHDRIEVPSQGLMGTISFDNGGARVRVSIFSLDDSHSLFKSVTVEP
ncbi:MAG TPA: hypothetical protein PKJ15_01910 [Methanomassiliicoccales archaeon]|nr:hypothetical protein [Methanomassiliicoccales archaeon]